MDERYLKRLALAAIRGHIIRTSRQGYESILAKPIELLSESDENDLLSYARENALKLYPFKRAERLLPRVHKVMGILKGLYFESLLDIGSGRGAFLIPFIEAFPHVSVTSVDLLEERFGLLHDVALGGIETLSPVFGDFTEMKLPEKSFDVVTLLEVLEHIPDVRRAVENALRAAKSHVIVTVPSEEDDNPEHIHLLTKDRLTELFTSAAQKLSIRPPRLTFSAVPSHLVLMATL